MIENAWTRWMPRLIVAVLAGAVPFASTVAESLADGAAHALEIELAASAGGTLQVFYDRGGGIVAGESGVSRINPSATAETYRVPLPLGRYQRFRIDPNDRPGRYTITRLRVVDASGSEVARLPVEDLRPALQVTIEPAAGGGVTLVTTPDANDPQVLFETGGALILAPPTADLARAAGLAAGVGLVMLALAALVDQWRGLAAWLAAFTGFIHRRPAAAAVAAGLVGALLATYPLLLGRSLVSPGNGPIHILYDQPPYVWGSTDRAWEDARGTDVGAMMWAILPYTMVQREALAAGEFPLWNRYNTMGEPLWGQGQTFIMDPLHLASLAIPDVSVAMDVRFIAGRVMFAVGSGLTVALVTGSGSAAVLVALMAPFVGHFTARFNHPAYFSLVWAPWILLAYAHLARQQTLGTRLSAGAWVALATWLQLVGSTPKEGLMALGAAHAAGVFGLLLAPGPWRDRLGRLDAAVLGGVVAILLGAPHWLVFLDTLSRAWTAYDQPVVQLANRAHLLGYIFGGAQPGMPLTGAHGLAVMAAVAGLLSPRALWRSGLGLGAALAVALVGGLAFGVLIPTEVLVKLPLVANIHHVANSFLGATVPLVLVVAGVGLASALDPQDEFGSIRLAVAAAAVLVVVASLVPVSVQGSTIVAFGAVIGSAAALLALALAPARPKASTGLALALAVPMAIGAGGLQLETGIAAADAVLIQPRPRADLDEPSPVIAAIQAAEGGDPFRVAPIEAVVFPGTQAYWGLEGIGGPDALRLPAIDALSDAAGVERTSWLWWTALRNETLGGTAPYLDMMGVRYLISRPDQTPPGLPVVPTEPDQVRAVERPSPWPRAFFTDGVERHSSLTDFATSLNRSTGPFASIDGQDVSALEVVGDLTRQPGRIIPATNYRITPNSTSFRLETPGPGLAVLGEAYVDQDFVATVNGRAVPYIRVNHAFKGVRIPEAGAWDVRFVYRPVRWGWAWGAATLGLACFLGLLMARPLLR